MSLCSDALMVLFYDIEGDSRDHDAWHSHEHFRERLSVPGFLRATRWVAAGPGPEFMVTYEVDSVDVATSDAYLDRLNAPSDWTKSMMPRFRGMVRGFCHVVAGAGLGLGHVAAVVRFAPEAGQGGALFDRLRDDVLPGLAARRGMAGAHLLRPAPPPPMTREQALRGTDRPLPALLIATAYDAAALEQAVRALLPPEALQATGAEPPAEILTYTIAHTATAPEARPGG